MSWIKIGSDYAKNGADFAKELTNQMIESIQKDSKSWVISASIGTFSFYIAKFYYNSYRYPKGPLPIPIVGNALMFRKKRDESYFELLTDITKVYGPIYTLWIGTVPVVFINNYEMAKDAFQRNELAGRPQSNILNFEGGTDLSLADYGRTWESLRRVAHSAVRKYAVSDRLAYLVSDVVDDTVKIIMDNEGINSPFEPFNYIYLMVYNMIASSAFGKRYAFDDPEIAKIKTINEELRDPIAFFLIESVPFLKLFIENSETKLNTLYKEFIMIIKEKYISHLTDYDNQIIRDFSDALIAAKDEALAEGKESAPYLTDINLTLVLFDLFVAGSNTTRDTLQWILLLMSNYPEMQKKMRNEIEEMIGDRMPLQDDKNKCHYINAFISECLRFRGVAPLGVAHKSIADIIIRGHKIPKNTIVLVNAFNIMTDPNMFADPLTFKPERFLESNGSYITSRVSGFIPFSIGRRVCLGERLALANLFLVTVRLLQATNGYELTLPDGPHSADLRPDPTLIGNCVAKKFKVIIRPIEL